MDRTKCSPPHEATIFKKTAGELAALLREAAVDHRAFEQPILLCDLTRCRATCCHDGVILSDEEAEILGSAEPGIETGPNGQKRTATILASPSSLADDFPEHFPKTRCVYLDEEHRCHWQLKGVKEGRSPWYYKPLSCWMHPVVLRQREGRPVLTVLSREEDSDRFASDTHCGRREPAGLPAWKSLRSELETLGVLSGRDFYGELSAPPAFFSDTNARSSG